jgi:hypothetical protein
VKSKRVFFGLLLLFWLGIAFGDDHGDMPSTATSISPSSVTEGVLENASDTDYFVFGVPETGVFEISVSGLSGSVLQLAVLDSDGRALVILSGVEDSSPRLVFEAGTYYVLVSQNSRRGVEGNEYQFTASFSSEGWSELTFSLDGPGLLSATIPFNAGLTDCGACSEGSAQVINGTEVILRYLPPADDIGSVVDTWQGCDSSTTNSCQVTVNSDDTVTAIVWAEPPDPTDPPDSADTDRDGIENNVDNCPTRANPDQQDTDGDGIGDACQADDLICIPVLTAEDRIAVICF